MATFLSSPISPSSLYIFSSRESTSNDDITHLSGETDLDSSTLPEAYLETPNTSPNMCSKPTMTSKRSSYASTTKSDLRQSNYALRQMFQNIQGELAAYRSIMLNIQSRVSNLEKAASADNQADGPHNTLDTQDCPTSHTSIESQTWWEACQNFARNCDTPFSANEFLKTPRRFSGFDFHFDAFKSSKPHTPPVTPEAANITQDLTSASNRGSGEQSNLSPNNATHSPPSSDPQLRSREQGSDILERILEFDKIKIPLPPVLQSPPRSLRSKSASVLSEEANNVTALPELPAAPLETAPPAAVETPQRSYKGIKSLFTYKALLKSKVPEKEYQGRMHFYRKGSGGKRGDSG
ncbi:Nn.00g011180.m01.CDS01 [Neocucurbitaria sp. VM-36]